MVLMQIQGWLRKYASASESSSDLGIVEMIQTILLPFQISDAMSKEPLEWIWRSAIRLFEQPASPTFVGGIHVFPENEKAMEHVISALQTQPLWAHKTSRICVWYLQQLHQIDRVFCPEGSSNANALKRMFAPPVANFPRLPTSRPLPPPRSHGSLEYEKDFQDLPKVPRENRRLTSQTDDRVHSRYPGTLPKEDTIRMTGQMEPSGAGVEKGEVPRPCIGTATTDLENSDGEKRKRERSESLHGREKRGGSARTRLRANWNEDHCRRVEPTNGVSNRRGPIRRRGFGGAPSRIASESSKVPRKRSTTSNHGMRGVTLGKWAAE
jgi:hypothetical protein